jgi:Uma2 family endonuclease
VPFVRSPRLIAEVISPATENIDRREKLMMYREIASLEEYVLVAQEKCEITIFRRREQWRPVIYNALEDLAEFRSIGLSLTLGQIYSD